jgi:hypothetical protein
MNYSIRFLSTLVLIISVSQYSNSAFAQTLQAVIPNPRTLTIDDVGWKLGADESAAEGPFRLGANRNPVMQDYEVLVYVARAVGTRLSAKFVLSEFDRENVLADYPSTNELGESWDNSALTGPDDFLYMNYVKDSAAWLELGFHGVRHEYWEWVVRRGKMYRWEFLDRLNKQPWPYDNLVGHLECFQKILEQYGINSFPKSYTPPGNGYHYAPQSGQDSGTLFSSFGVKYAMCNIRETLDFGTPQSVIDAGGVIHNGLLWIQEAGVQDDPNWPLWNAVDAVPSSIPADGIPLTHWPNWWANNPDSNLTVGDKYIAWFDQVKQRPDTYVPKNIPQYFSQWLYRKYAMMVETGDSLTIDNTAMPADAYTYDLLGNLLIKFPLVDGEHLSQASIDGGAEVVGYYEEFGYGHLLLSPLQQQVYHLRLTKGPSLPAACVLNDGTYNILSFKKVEETATFIMEMFGAQDVKMRLDFEPLSITSIDTGLVVNSWRFDHSTRELTINVSGKDIMGQRGTIFIQGAPFQKLELVSPNGGENYLGGSEVSITWNAAGAVALVKLEFSSDAGNTWTIITTATENDGAYIWTIPEVISDHGLIRISDAADGDPSDASDASFSIQGDTSIVTSPAMPADFALHQSYPNPFANQITRIQFDLPRPEQVRLVIYDVRGREVRRLVSGAAPAGRHTSLWDGTDTSGRRVSSGIYFYHLQAGRFEAIRKITVLH